MAERKKRKVSSFQIIILGFAGVILLGALLLMLPVSSESYVWTPFDEALFTSTSAVCVTGLVVQDTATYWSVFGEAVILLLIQIGGLGVVTIAAAFTMLSGRKISLMQRSTMQEAIAAPKVGGIMKLTVFILKVTFAIELIGALLLMPIFVRDFGGRGVWMAFFHSISAFCNAGFDLMGSEGAEFASLTGYSVSPLVNIVIMLLIIIGGIGFLTWEDIASNKFRFRRYRMQSKVILITSALLIVLPAIFLYFCEFTELPIGEGVLNSLFQSVTTRTAGFNTADLASMGGAARAIMIVLMMVGGSPGSTAGGMKTTTFALLLTNLVATFRRKESVTLYGRRVENGVIKNAATIFVMYLVLFFAGAISISMIEGLPMDVCFFETASAVGTVGLTLGITPALGMASHMILIVLMFIGRVGGLTLIYAALSGGSSNVSKLPQEKITVG